MCKLINVAETVRERVRKLITNGKVINNRISVIDTVNIASVIDISGSINTFSIVLDIGSHGIVQ